MKRPRTFPLMRYFVIMSALTIVVVATGVAAISSWEVRKDLVLEAKENAEMIAAHLQKDIRARFVDPTLAAGERIDLNQPSQYRRLDSVVRPIADSFSILQIHIFDDQGFVIYSTDENRVGSSTSQDNHLFTSALQGVTGSEVKEEGEPLDLEGGAPAVLLETYVPAPTLFTASGSGRVGNVIETYQNIEFVQSQVHKAQFQIISYVTTAGVIAFLVLISIVLRADRLIRRQTRELVASNDRLTQLSQHLESEVERRTQQLLDKEKLASLGTLAAGLAHEVNNPLATIAGCAEGLLHRLKEHQNGGHDAPEFERYLELIQKESFRVKRITQNLLDFSRQRVSLDREPTEVLSLLRETVELVRVGQEIDDVPVTICCNRTSIDFPVQPTDLRQLIFNITINAADSVRERWGAEAQQEGRVEWRVEASADSLELLCRDNGAGFEPEHAGDLLEPFATTKSPGKGTGLGLALCHSMVERHGGSLELVSEGPGRGAEVRIHLPREARTGAS